MNTPLDSAAAAIRAVEGRQLGGSPSPKTRRIDGTVVLPS
jgi:hypothetical protein